MKKIIILLLSLPKTVKFNLKYMGFKDAVKLPVWIHYKTRVLIEGIVNIPATNHMASIRIGFHKCDECNPKDKTLFKVQGKVVFKGEAHIGCGSKIIVNEGAVLELGDNFAISASSTISCHKHIKFGRDIQFSWDCLVMDSDTHAILDEQGNRINEDKEIVFGDKVWIGNGCMILKGTHIPDNCVIGARSVVAGAKFDDHSIIVGNPARSVKKIGGFRI